MFERRGVLVPYPFPFFFSPFSNCLFSSLSGGMSGTGNIESKPVFRARAVQIGISDAVIRCIEDANLATFGAFAFSCSYQPGSQDETVFIRMVHDTLGRDATQGELALLRRLFFESHSVSMQDMKNRLERPTDAAPAKVLPAERAARYEEQCKRLKGLDLTGPMEPSNSLIDAVFAMVDSNELRYLPLHTLTSREQELLGEKEDADLKEYSLRIKSGSIGLKEKLIDLKADLTSDLKVRFAMQRRALAFDQAGLISWELHDKWISLLFHRMQESPPPGYSMTSLDQALRADRKIFVKMSEMCRANIVPLPGLARPLDTALEKYMDHNDVLYLLAPMPNISESSTTSGSNRFQPYENKISAKGKGGNKGKGKGKGKSKGKQGGKSVAPQGCLSKTPDGKNICFGFNRQGGCSSTEVRPGGSCSRGYHICGRANCHENHPMYECTRPH